MKKPDKTVIERRIVFLLLVLAVALPIILPLGLKTQSTPSQSRLYDLRIPAAGAPVIISFDYDPPPSPNCSPWPKL